MTLTAMESITILPVVLSVAFVTLADRKGIALVQRRVGPDTVGLAGSLQPFSDALKLLLKELIYTSLTSKKLMLSLPCLTLTTNLLSYPIIPLQGTGVILDSSLQILITLALIGLSVQGVLYISWSGANTFSFLGGLRAVAQVVSYELILSAVMLTCALYYRSLHYVELYSSHVSAQVSLALLVLGPLFLISALAETGRTPFDLPEAESEIVAGFITELSAVPFVIYFLAEYSSLILLSLVAALLFLGVFSVPVAVLLLLGLAIWCRGALPRVRFDQLISIGWNELLPLATAAVGIVLTVILVSPTLLNN